MLSISSTFREALLLALKYFWLLVVLAIMTKLPAIFMNVFWISPKHSDPIATLVSFAVLLVGVILDAANRAAVLALLTQTSGEVSVWRPIWNNIQDFTWTLFRVSLLLVGVAILLLIPVCLLIKLFGSGNLVTVFATAMFLIFAKYALADPLVVLENMGARAALKRSWEMTRGHFWYVAGCYLFLGGMMWFAEWLVEPPLHDRQASMAGASLMIHFCFALADNIWIIIAWVMYHRIKTEEEHIAEVAKAFTTQSPPEPPSASQSA